jgi:alpha-tubulin suppressor-like RCC1 family protein
MVNMTGIAAGNSHALALKSDGTIWAWGSNSFGQLGDGTTINRITAVQASGLTAGALTAAGYFHSLVRKTDGTIWAWGSNLRGQLGDGTTTDRLIPVHGVGF